MDSTTFGIYLVSGIASFAVSVFILRWAFGVNRALLRLEAIKDLLIEIAKKQGVEQDKLETIDAVAEHKII